MINQTKKIFILETKYETCLIPYIQKEFNPNIIEGINRLSSIATEEERFLNSIVEEEYKRIVIVEKAGEKNNAKAKHSTNYIAQNSKTQNANSIIEEIEKETNNTK